MAYPEQVKADALTLLELNGGNVYGTAKQLGVPRMTLAQWANGEHLNEGVTRKRQQKKQELAARFEELANACVSKALTIARRRRDQNTSLSQAATAAGIAVDKMRLLREEGPPPSEAERSAAESIRQAAAALVQLTEGTAGAMTITEAEIRIKQIQLGAAELRRVSEEAPR